MKKEHHAYELRENEKYEIFRAKSERYKNSTILQMQYTANKLFKEGKIK